MSKNSPKRNEINIHIDKPASLTTSSTTVYTVPTGYILEIEQITIQKDGNAGSVALTDSGTYIDGSTSYSKTVHEQYLGANEFDDTRDVNVRVFGTLSGVCGTGNATVIIKGRLI